MKRLALYFAVLFSFAALGEEHSCKFGDAKIVVNDNDEGLKSWQLIDGGAVVAGTEVVQKKTRIGDAARRFLEEVKGSLDKDTKEAMVTESLLSSMSSLTVFTLEDKDKSETPMFLCVFRSKENALIAKWAVMFDVMGTLAVIECAE